MTGTIEISNNSTQCIKRMTLEATVTRADGTVEKLGTIADSKAQSPLGRISSFFRA
jgi:hypothetical protein